MTDVETQPNGTIDQQPDEPVDDVSEVTSDGVGADDVAGVSDVGGVPGAEDVDDVPDPDLRTS